MKRRSVVQHAGLAGIVAAFSAPAVHAQPALRWRLATAYNPIADQAHAGAELFARQVGLMSGGRFQISVQLPDEPPHAQTQFDALQHGEVDAIHVVPGHLASLDEVFALDSAIPFGLNSRQMSAWQIEGNGQKLLREFYATHQIVNFPMGNSGAQMGGWYRRDVTSVADFRGLRMHIHGLATRVLQALGGLPQQLPVVELVGALERGTLDAVEWVGPHDDRKLGLGRIARNYYYPGWWEGSAQLSLYCGAKAWRALGAEQRAIVEAAAAMAHQWIQARYDALNPPAIRQLVASGVKVKAFPREVMDAAFKASNALYAEISRNNPVWRRIYADYAHFRRDQNLWYRLAEASFDRYMQSARL